MAGDNKEEKKYSRRDFVIGSGTAIAGGAFTAITAATPAEAAVKPSYPLSTMYLVYDSRHCAGCLGCMLACSMVHEGMTSFSLSRIQVHRTVLAKYPLDIQQNVCRQCPDPLCVKHCPVGAAHVSTQNGNIRMINETKCIGCQNCIKSCPHIPHRPIWNPAKNKSTKCDMCVRRKRISAAMTEICSRPRNLVICLVSEIPEPNPNPRQKQPITKEGRIEAWQHQVSEAKYF